MTAAAGRIEAGRVVEHIDYRRPRYRSASGNFNGTTLVTMKGHAADSNIIMILDQFWVRNVDTTPHTLEGYIVDPTGNDHVLMAATVAANIMARMPTAILSTHPQIRYFQIIEPGMTLQARSRNATTATQPTWRIDYREYQ